MKKSGLKTILVTGGGGYIGSHACKALADAGYLPITYDNFVYGHQSAVQWGPYYEGDICDRNSLAEAFELYQPEAVLHFAAYAYVGESVINPGKYYRNNVVGSLTLLEVMRDYGVKKIIFSSTCATYGLPAYSPIDEVHSQRPISPYGASKLMIERIISDFEVAHDIKSISLRYFNAAGADPAGKIGEDHNPETHLIPLLFNVALGRTPAITIFGSDYETSDGTCIRDYIHVADLADAHLKALLFLEENMQSQSFNLGGGRGYSVIEVIREAEAVIGKKIQFNFGARREGDAPILVANSNKAKEMLSWAPNFPELKDILRTSWKWHSKNL
ncbi:UDP-glucose 4-epimerase GalE [Polynucleobacter sp. AP-Elch-400A-B2]|uniref:UDP-glucose 4-epimerase GalE n=1 Tax=Polynucleobacter sp. AP-Elch-400A-B2 TaxID=2576930 RepID=UPI001BFCF27C|nr:UDP-glucose 4-epimerase GalE [Polynucleobacter sp. AP-Elch-400A-B2]QWE24994.1 UDP-glucose 4-epimerase GalE [Polynucleobacter sp. AP-Elch-400A-B2]